MRLKRLLPAGRVILSLVLGACIMPMEAVRAEDYDLSFIDRPFNFPVSQDTTAKRLLLKQWYAKRIDEANQSNKFSFERINQQSATKRLPKDYPLSIKDMASVAQDELLLKYPLGTSVNKLVTDLTFVSEYAKSSCKEDAGTFYCYYLLATTVADKDAGLLEFSVRAKVDADKKIVGIKVVSGSAAVQQSFIPFK